jgi:hypothetical protein
MAKSKEPEKPLSRHKWKILAILLIAAIGLLIYYNLPAEKVQVEAKNITNNTQSSTPPASAAQDNSFDIYLANRDTYNDKVLSLVGYLGTAIKGTAHSGVYMQVLTDDKGNWIELTSLTSKEMGLFPATGQTAEKFNVTGKFTKSYDGADLEVYTIRSIQ